ncbi:hypothetical protein [Ureibacillus acetophenoni]|uniref:Uncharacterized protein n=1 Tax=Ureibacillus acetophenoni TaxID=614649 RepID=A0A285UI98_9BACL|nr:hypothetical protein [Ureibacillus acetophenoni]SOC41532.1 hypothetical protein SAMN05877842_110143 [Ureibacillus acetophenoni]
MRSIKYFFIHFLSEPWWFKLLIIATLFSSIFFSSFLFESQPYLQSFAKLAAAVFFGAYGYKMRRSRMHFRVFSSLALLCIVLAILELLW